MKIVNFKTLSLLLMIAFVLQAVYSVLGTAAYPPLRWIVSLCWWTNWMAILSLSMFLFVKRIREWSPGLHVLKVVRGKNATNEQVPVEHLHELRLQLRDLNFALYSTTAEQMQARRTEAAMHDGAPPALIVPLRNRALFGEYQGLLRMLTHVGFFALGDVHLQQQEFEFFLIWVRDLNQRLSYARQLFQNQQAAIHYGITSTKRFQKEIANRYPEAHLNADFQRLQGAFTLFEKMIQEDDISYDVVPDLHQRIHDKYQLLLQQLQQQAS